MRKTVYKVNFINNNCFKSFNFHFETIDSGILMKKLKDLKFPENWTFFKEVSLESISSSNTIWSGKHLYSLIEFLGKPPGLWIKNK